MASKDEAASTSDGTETPSVAKGSGEKKDTKTPTAKPPTGTVELGDGVGVIGHHLVHDLIDQGAGEVAAAVRKSLDKGDRVLIVSDLSLAASDWSYHLVSTRLKRFKKAFEKREKAFEELPMPSGVTDEQADQFVGLVVDRALGVISSAANVSTLVGGVADVVGWFRSDYAVKGGKVEVGEGPLLAALAGHLLEGKEQIEVTLDAFRLLSGSGLLELYADVAKARNRVAALAAGKAAGDLVASFDAFVAEITASPEGGGHAPLLVAALHERIYGGDSPFTHVLYCGLDSAQGESISRSWLWSDPTIRHLGGVQVSYLLLAVKGNALKKAGTLPLLGSAGYRLRSGQAGPLRRIRIAQTPGPKVPSSHRRWGLKLIRGANWGFKLVPR